MSLAEAISGAAKTIAHLDGRQIPVRMQPLASTDAVKVVPGEGMLNSKTRSKGDLKIKFTVRFPELSSEDKSQVLKILSKY